MTGHPHSGNEPEPSWDEAVAAFGSGEAVDLIRPNRKVVIDYGFENHHIRATSPDLTGFEAIGSTLDEARRLVRASLARYLDSGVELLEHEPEPAIFTASISTSRVIRGPRESITTTARGRSRAFITLSPVRAV